MQRYTVIIPTRDRAETLEATLRTCLRQAYENFEIIVSDNCSSDNTKEIVERCNDPRVRYVNPGRRLSMSGNFEFALGHVVDGFVMFIGSDDGIMPDAIEYVDSIVRQHGVEAVSCRQATYVWPEFPDAEIAGRLVFGGQREDVEIRRSREWIKRTLSFEAFYCLELPNLYCGFVHKHVIDKARRDGTYFHSITPDAYSAFATAIFVETYAFSHRPFSIAGASPKSNGASSMHPAGSGHEVSKFVAENDIELSKGFVMCPGYEVATGEAFASLAEVFPDLCSPYEIDYAAMLGDALKGTNPKTEQEVRSAVAIMAANFGVDLVNGLRASQEIWPRRWLGWFRALANLARRSRMVALPKSRDYGVKNVDDAALVAHVLDRCSRDAGYITNRGLLRRGMKRLAGY